MYIQRFFIHTPLFLSLSQTGLLPANIILHGICIPIPLFTAFPVISTVAEFIVSVRRKQNIYANPDFSNKFINYPGFFELRFFEPPIFRTILSVPWGFEKSGLYRIRLVIWKVRSIIRSEQ